MTAQIAILNKSAIALATDSAVTIKQVENEKDTPQSNKEKNKTYQTVNKLFTLSKYAPIGVMIYGNAGFMKVPWETIIKAYRQHLGDNNFDTLDEYSYDFISFIQNEIHIFPPDEQRFFFNRATEAYFNLLKKEIDAIVKKTLEEKGKIEVSEIESIVTGVINSEYQASEKVKDLPNFEKKDIEDLIDKFEKDIICISKKVFRKRPLTDSISQQLVKLSVNDVCKDRFSQSYSGVVIAGFGKKDRFPKLRSFLFETLVNKKLKFKSGITTNIAFNKPAAIVPFAEKEMVTEFMTGVHPTYISFINGYLKNLFSEYANQILNSIYFRKEEDKSKFSGKLKQLNRELIRSLMKDGKSFQSQRHIKPVMNTVVVLPKDELATMAEALVNLTQFRQRITMDIETVAGAIDVAVISKGDGFIWIKRKHYFEAPLNPQFFANYFK